MLPGTACGSGFLLWYNVLTGGVEATAGSIQLLDYFLRCGPR